jgi:hypothetical protein
MSNTILEARAELKRQLAEYLAQQPESTLSAHRWMKRLEVAGAGVIVAAFCIALYVSITWKSTNPILIPTTWFVFAASPVFVLIFLGVDAILLHAFPTVILPGRPQKFVTGNGAVWIGAGEIVGGLILATFWLVFAYAVGTVNWTMMIPLINLLGGAAGVLILISILAAFYQKLTQSR